MNTIRNIAIAAFAISAVAGIGAASAQEYRTATVHTGDLNLLSVEGQASLDARLRAAARRACADLQGLGNGLGYGRCLSAATKSANAGRMVAIASAQRGTMIASR